MILWVVDVAGLDDVVMWIVVVGLSVDLPLSDGDKSLTEASVDVVWTNSEATGVKSSPSALSVTPNSCSDTKLVSMGCDDVKSVTLSPVCGEEKWMRIGVCGWKNCDGFWGIRKMRVRELVGQEKTPRNLSHRIPSLWHTRGQNEKCGGFLSQFSIIIDWDQCHPCIWSFSGGSHLVLLFQITKLTLSNKS